MAASVSLIYTSTKTAIWSDRGLTRGERTCRQIRATSEFPLVTTDPISITPSTDARTIFVLSFIGVALCAIVAVGLLLPASLFEYGHSIRSGEPITEIFDTESKRWQLTIYAFAYGALFLVALKYASRLVGQAGVRVVLVIGVALGLLFTLVFPIGSQDIFHNVADARTLRVYHENPNIAAPGEFSEDPLGRQVVAFRHDPSAYGPLTYVLYLVPSTICGTSVQNCLIAFKAYNALWVLVAAILAGMIAESLRTGSRTVAMASIAWNPLFLFEAVGNGHNDLFLAVFLLLAVQLILIADARGAAWSLGASAACKFASVAVAPVFALWLWRRGEPRSAIVFGAIFGAIASILAAYVALIVKEFTEVSIGQIGWSSPISVIGDLLRDIVGVTDSLRVARAISGVLLIVVYASLLRRLDPSKSSLVEVAFWVMLSLVLLTPTRFFPWYLMWAVPLGACLPRSNAWLLSMTMSLSVLLTYAFLPLPAAPLRNAGETFVYFGVPALIFLARVVWSQRQSDSTGSARDSVDQPVTL